MTVSLSQQLYIFALAALVGVALGILYDAFKILRLLGLNGAVVVFIEDILFFAISTLTFFSFYMQITDGKFRIYPLISAAIGFTVYFLTLEKVVYFVIKRIYLFISSIFKFIYNKIVLFAFKKITKILKSVFKPIWKIFRRFFKENITNFFKKLLPKRRKMLYNNLKRKNNGRGKRSREKEQEKREKAFFC